MQKNNLLMLYVLLLILNASCASVPDTIICAEVSLSKGVCTYTVSQKTITIDDEHLYENQTWFDIRSKALTVPASSWAKLKAFMIKQCKVHKCDVDISSWDRDLQK